MRGNYKTRFRGGQNLTAVEEKASVYQVYSVSRTTGEGRPEIFYGRFMCHVTSLLRIRRENEKANAIEREALFFRGLSHPREC